MAILAMLEHGQDARGTVRGASTAGLDCWLAIRQLRGYTPSMKTTVSIPGEIYHAAEQLARLAKKSRSRLYADALREYLVRHAPDEVTEAMNRAIAEGDEDKDLFASATARRILERSEW
jgi:predicted transcriptional regulator